MRPVSANPNNTAATIAELCQASRENDVIDIGQNFTMTGTLTQTTDLNLSSPTVANVAAVLGTLLEIMQKGGINRST